MPSQASTNSMLVSSDSESEEAEYVVEGIRDWRYNLREGRHEYFIKWQHYKEDDNTWEPRENLTNCFAKLEKFEKNLSKREKKYYRARNPDSLTGFQRKAEFLECIGADGPHDSDLEDDSPKMGKQRFYCLVRFEDSDLAEEVTIKELYKHKPHEAFKFFEQRLLCERHKTHPSKT